MAEDRIVKFYAGVGPRSISLNSSGHGKHGKWIITRYAMRFS